MSMAIMNMDLDAFETNMNRVNKELPDFELTIVGFFEGVFGTDGITKLNEL